VNELEALVVLNNMSLLGPVKARRLVEYFGSAVVTLQAAPEELVSIPGIGSAIVQSLVTWRQQDSWKNDLKLIHEHQIRLLAYNDDCYPSELKKISNPPLLIYVKGTILDSDLKSIAVIGTRNCTVYGRELAISASEDLAEMGLTIVSGLARGIDTAAHHGALKKGRTIAVIGSGLAKIYPTENRSLAAAIQENGAIISEFPMETAPDRHNFPRRNRIVSGISLGVVLIEAPIKSGAMITMEQGLAQGRSLFAFPGRVDMETFAGNHHLIKKGLAKLIESVHDISVTIPELSNINHLFQPLQNTQPPLDPEETSLLILMPSHELSIEDLTVASQIPIGKLNSLLMSLVLKKVVKEFPGKIYKKVRGKMV
jgi:DNA processing protein